MGQAPSCNQVGGNIDTLTNAQIRDNIENLFRSPNTNTVKIENTDNGYATSVVEVDTIAPLKGGNKSRVSVMPKRQRFKTVPIKMRGGTHENLDEDDLKALKKVLYHNAEPEQSDTELKSETVQPAEQTYVDSATSELRSDEELVADENEPQPPHPQIADDLLKQVPEQASEQAPEKVSEQVPEQVPEPVVETVQPEIFQSNLVGGTQSEYSIDKEISMIRSFISNTIKQRGGEPTVVDDDNDILSEEGLATIRESLAKNGVQIGGNVDEELKIFKDNILNSAQAFALSATSSEQSSLLTNLKGGLSKSAQALALSATSSEQPNLLVNFKGGAKPAEKKNKKEDDDDNEDEDDEETEENEDENEDENDEDEEEDEDDYDEEDGMSGGDHSKDSSSSSDSDSSKSDSSSSSNSSSSSSSDSSVTNSAVAVMHNAINKNMDRKNNKSKYLQENGYKVTTNSDRDYKINNRPMYSSQSSDVYSNIGGSDYLNSMRNRDRTF